MRRLISIIVLVGFAALAGAQTFTDIDSPQYYGKVNIPKTHAAIDANFAKIESGTVDADLDALQIRNTLTAISTNGATTNVIVTVDGVVDGETIADDTIDNDSIDWSDMTDLTTDGAVSWGNLGEGELKDSAIVSADIKDNTVVADDVANGAFGTAADIYIDYGTCTNGQTVTFTAAFGAAPSVCLTYAEDAGEDTVCEAVSITTTNFVVQAAAAKDVSYIAVGTIP